MESITSPVPYIAKREYGLVYDIRSQLFKNRLNAAKNLFRRDLVCHFGCVNAIEFSRNGELLVSGGDDRRVMLWQFGQAVMNHGKPEPMKVLHQSNIFCLGITSDNQKIYSGGNDDIVIIHDVECKCPMEILQHQKAVCSLSIDPFNERVISTAGNDGRLLLFDTRQSVHESLVIYRSRKAFHGVMFHPHQVGILASANERDGVALWDLRSPKHPVLRYVGNNGTHQNSMSVRFNQAGTHIFALRPRNMPVLYSVQSPEPVTEFYHQDYYNSCTMKSCSFAGKDDQFVLSGSDDFNLYMWKIPDMGGTAMPVNQVRYNSQYCLIASSGVEKIIKMTGSLLDEAQGSDNPREIYSQADYISLVHHSGQYITHNYAEQSTSEDPRMMAFFDSVVQRELDCPGEETDSLDGSSSVSPRALPNGNRSQRRSKDSRSCVSKFGKNVSGASCKGKRAVVRRPRGVRRKIGPLRRRLSVARSSKRKTKLSYMRTMNLRNSGYRGQTPGLFRIAEVDSDDDQSVGGRQSPRSQNQNIPANLISIVPTPVNGSRDSLGDSLRMDTPASPHEARQRTSLRRSRRNGRHTRRSDSSESPPPKDACERASTSLAERLSPKGFNRTVARLMNETNESEIESSCSTEGSLWPTTVSETVDSGGGAVAGSSTHNTLPEDDASDDPEFQIIKFRQRVKKARRNYRSHKIVFFCEFYILIIAFRRGITYIL
ncbi:unnamed protein product, partial [Leptidea sinapis]